MYIPSRVEWDKARQLFTVDMYCPIEDVMKDQGGPFTSVDSVKSHVINTVIVMRELGYTPGMTHLAGATPLINAVPAIMWRGEGTTYPRS